MRKLLLSCCLAGLVLMLSCSDNDTSGGVITPTITYDDIKGSWRGTVDSWRVVNTVGHPSYSLENIDITLVFDTQNYWLQLTQISDSLEYQYYNRGFWLWDPYVPDVMVFEIYEESSTQIFNPLQSSNPGNPDSTGNGGGNNVPPDTVKTVLGDNTQMEARFISFMELEENQMRLWDFIEYLNLGDVTLDKN
jgi:hypothetical protein